MDAYISVVLCHERNWRKICGRLRVQLWRGNKAGHSGHDRMARRPCPDDVKLQRSRYRRTTMCADPVSAVTGRDRRVNREVPTGGAVQVIVGSDAGFEPGQA